MYEIWGGDTNLLSYWDGGPDEFLASCSTLSDAVETCEVWQKNKYAAHIRDINSGIHFTPTDVRNGTVPRPGQRRKRA